MLGSIGLPEILFIFVLALLIFGPKRLPGIGRSLGRAMGEFRRATNDLKRSWDAEASRLDVDEPAAPSSVRTPAVARGEPRAATETAAGEEAAEPEPERGEGDKPGDDPATEAAAGTPSATARPD